MIRFISFLFLGVFCLTEVNAQSLLPNESIFDIKTYQFNYYAKVRYKLFENLSDNPEIRMVVKPSFSPEYIFQIEKSKNENYVAKLNIASENIWYAKNFDSVSIQKFSAEIKKEDANLLSEIFSKILEKTHYKNKLNFTTDGVFYNLSSGSKSGTFRSGDYVNLGGNLKIIDDLIKKIKNNEKTVSLNIDEIKSLNEFIQKLNRNPQLENYELAIRIKELIEESKEFYLSKLSEEQKLQLEKHLIDFEKDILLELTFHNLEKESFLRILEYYKRISKNKDELDNIFEKLENSLK